MNGVDRHVTGRMGAFRTLDFNALAGEHGDQIEAAVEKVGEVVRERFGHAEQVDMAVDKIKELIPDGPPADGA